MSGSTHPAAEPRRRELRHAQSLNGIDYLETEADRRIVKVVLFRPPPEPMTRENFHVTGGVRVRDPTVREVRLIEDTDPDVERAVRLVFARPGDSSTYRLQIQGVAGFDPRYARIDFTFGDTLDRRLDCLPPPAPPPAAPPAPELDYLARDYAGFRRLAFDRLAQTLPGWTERHIPDIGVMLVEMMAYVGDQLSYFQDAVATEAYLGTARLRSSVRRHARLIDYVMHEGCNARTWVHVTVPEPLALPAADIGFAVIEDEFPVAEFAPVETGTLHFDPAHNAIALYAWGDGDCCLSAGSTAATLRDSLTDTSERMLAGLHAGQALLIETIAMAGSLREPDPMQRHVVRITTIERTVDPLYDVPVVAVTWAPEDALPFSVALPPPGSDPPGSDPRGTDPLGETTPELIGIVRGNMVMADHGRRVEETIPERLLPVPHVLVAAPDSDDVVAPVFTDIPRRPRLRQRGLTFREPPDLSSPATLAVQQTVYRSVPQILSLRCQADPRLGLFPPAPPGDPGPEWTPQRDLIGSAPEDLHVVVEPEDDGTVVLRFGDGDRGARPGDGPIRVVYRVGNGPAGNVGAGTITRVLGYNGLDVTALTARNPLPAIGGTAPETIANVKRLAPSIFRAKRQRAITAEDYARAAEDVFGVRRAAADIVRLGSLRLVRVSVLPLHGDDPPDALLARVTAHLTQQRRIGHDIQVGAPRLVALDVALVVGVHGDYLRYHVLAALRDALGCGMTASGQPGFFHPDHMSFGTPVHGSRIVAAAQAVTGVEWVRLTRLRRLTDAPPDDRAQIASAAISIELEPFEVARMDNDPARPEHGRLSITLRGGR